MFAHNGFATRLTATDLLFLQVYDVWPIKIGPFLESGLVPLVLAPIWVLYGYLYPLLDQVFAEEASTELARERASSFSFLALTWLSCGLQFILSDILYLQGAPHWQASYHIMRSVECKHTAKSLEFFQQMSCYIRLHTTIRQLSHPINC